MKFEIAINNLRLKAIIGILPFERENAQEIAVDLEAIYALDSAQCEAFYAESKIINYAILREIVLELFKQNKFLLLEGALVAIQRAILERFPQILELNVSIKKLAIFGDCVPQVRLSWKKCESLDCHESTQNTQILNGRQK